MTRIDSPANPRIAAVTRAVAEGDLMLLEGRRMIEEALDAEIAVNEVFVQSEMAEENEDLLGRLSGGGAARGAGTARVTPVSSRVLRKISDLPSSRGVAATAPPPRRALAALARGPEAENSLFLLLDDVQDPANVGAILRCAEAFGVAAAITTPGCAWPFSPRALRASAGSALRVPIATRVPAAEAVAWARASGAELAGAEAHGGASPASAARIRPLVLVVGSEGRGISPDVEAALGRRLTLPLAGRVESLNAAVAAGLLLFIVSRP